MAEARWQQSRRGRQRRERPRKSTPRDEPNSSKTQAHDQNQITETAEIATGTPRGMADNTYDVN